jgi:GNAT superfamily N-acetyltransferase
VAHQIEECERHVAAGGLALGAFAAGRLIGIGIVVPHFRAAVAQLAVLYVTDEFRGCGVGRELHNLLEREARQLGATQIVVSATPSKNTVDFYLRRGFTPTASPIRELYDLEPEDVHMEKGL